MTDLLSERFSRTEEPPTFSAARTLCLAAHDAVGDRTTPANMRDTIAVFERRMTLTTGDAWEPPRTFVLDEALMDELVDWKDALRQDAHTQERV